MLKRAKAKGYSFRGLCNAALRIHLPKLGFNVRKYAK